MIRAMRPADVAAVRSLIKRGNAAELTAPSWPKTPPENQAPSPLSLLRDALVPSSGTPRVGLAASGQGMVVTQPRAARLVWDIQHLVASPSNDTAVELLHWACDQARAQSGRRVFLETAEEGRGCEVAGRAGFEQCTSGGFYLMPPGAPFDKSDAVPSRPRLRSDEMGLFQLYNAVVPAPVRAAEALDYEEWAALHRGRKLWSPSVLGAEQDYVWEMGSRVVGWMHIVFGERAQYLTMLIHPQADAHAERMLRDALGQLSPKATILADVREYQASLIGALEQVGFTKSHGYLVWVKQLAQRVLEPAVSTVQARPTALA